MTYILVSVPQAISGESAGYILVVSVGSPSESPVVYGRFADSVKAAAVRDWLNGV